MNNKGFGLQELLVFIGLFLFILVAIAIYLKVKVGNNIFYEEPIEEINQEEKIDYGSTEVEIPNEYLNIEKELMNAAKKYQFNKNQNTIITLKQLQDKNLIKKLIDPHDNTITCKGYVVYKNSNNEYIPYINCNGMYVTELYDSNLEN